jgi:beta-mannosidase
MEPQYLIPDDFEEFLYVGQLLQAEAIKMAIESHRSDRPYCMGTLYWQLNDCWPVASWSGIDYYGRWKALHYFVKESLKPVALVVEDLDGKVRVHIVSDLPGTEAATLKVKLIRFDGQELWKESIPVQIPAGSSSLYFEKDITGIEPAEMVLVTTLGSGSTSYDTDLHYFAGPKDLKLTDPGITLAVNEERDLFKITLTSRALAKNVFLTVDGLDGQFSDNFFDVLPGEEVIVTFPKSGTLQGFRGGIRLLHLYQTNH